MDNMEVAIDVEPEEMGYEAFMRGQCSYRCHICDRMFFDR